ncbi:MAG: two-component regulator propeller domain-containing protein, partial [Ignavibacteriaceae bacterium]
FTHFKHNPFDPGSMSTDNTYTIYEDKRGLVWVGTAGRGLSKYNKARGKIIHYKKEYDNTKSLNSNTIHPIFEDDSGILWIGTSEGGLNKLDRKKGFFTHYKHKPDNLNSLINNDVFSIIEEKPGLLWIGSRGGLSRFDIKKNQFMNFKYDSKNPQSLNYDYVYSLHIDRSNNLWIGTIGGGLNKLILNENKKAPPVFTHYKNNLNDPHSISGNSVTAIYEDNDGFLWVGADGLNKFDKRKEKFFRFQHDPNNPNSLSNNLVSTIYQDKNGVLWIGTEGGGLNKLVPGDNEESPHTFIHYREKDGLSNNRILGILEDDHQNLWISTRNGLSKFNPKEVDDKGVTLPSAFKNYYSYDGFQGNVFNPMSYFKNNRGEMFFGGINGFNAFYPDSLKENLTIPAVVITDFKVLNEDYKLDTSITEINQIVLSYNENFFSFDFAVLDYTTPENNNYAYKLDGLDNDWNYVDNRNFAHYTNLSPGKYVFCVKGSNNNGIWNEKGTSIIIIITPPWWATWWSYTIYASLLFGLIYILRRYELNRQNLKHSWELKRSEAENYQEIDRMKSRFFANISHEFRTPLTLIKGPVQQMLSGDFKGNIEKQYKIILRNTNRLMQLINQLLDLSKLDSGQMTLKTSPENMLPLLKGLTQSFESLAKQKNITLQFQSSDTDIIAYIDRDKFEKIVINLLSNAFKFTPDGGYVSVSVNLQVLKTHFGSEITGMRSKDDETTSVKIAICNSGPGINPEQLNKIFDRFYQADDSSVRTQEGTGIGLALTKELVELHHGEIKVDSEPGTSTTFTIRLPLGKEHLLPEQIIETSAEVSSDIKIDSDLVESSLSPESKAETTSHQRDKDFPTLLIVDDNPDMRNYMHESLESNYKIIEAENGEVGIQQALKHSPDMIISDVMMPKMDGFQFCSKIKKDERTSHIPVILLTAKASGESKIEGLETGADDYLTKPFDTRELQVRIKNLIEQRRKLQEKFRREIIVNPGDITVTSIDEQLLQRAINAVENNISDPDFDTTTMAKEVGVSRMLLHTKLKALTGLSTGEFIRTLRLKRAAQLLKQGSGNVTQIAYDVGFQSLSYFAKTFRKQFGQSPSHYTSKDIKN